MGIYNLNPRRVVWFSPNEPSNKYDIWLSRNAHLDENGEPTTDSNSQRDCDYIFRIYDCGKWNPIVGFNTTAVNKIDTVTGVDYTIDGVTHSGKNVYHPAIFTAESPNELYDAGTLGELLKDTHFVTEGDWNDIYNKYIKTIIKQYPFDLWPAKQNELGGIFAARYNGNYADSNVSGNTFLTQCKYKYQAPTDYHLYVHAKDIMQTIHDYTGEHGDDPGFPSILPPNIGGNITIDPAVLYRSFYNSPTILKGWTDDQNSAQKPRFELAGARTLQNRGKLLMLKPADDPFWSNIPSECGESSNENALNWVSPDELFGEYSYELPLASIGAPGGIRAAAHASLPVPHTVECKLGTNLSFALNAQYKKQALHIDVKDVKNALDEWYADNDSTIWDLDIQSNFGISTMKHTSVDDENVTHIAYAHVLDHYTINMQDGLYPRNKTYTNPVPGLYNGTKGLEWVGAQTIVEEGLGIGTGNAGYLYYNGSDFYLDHGTGGGGGGSVTLPPYLLQGNCNSQGERIIYVPNGGTGGNKKYLNGYGEWSVPEGTTYNDFRGSTHGLVPASTLLTQDKYLKGDGTWGTPTVSAEFDIDMDSAAVSDDYNFTLSNMSLTSNNTVSPINKLLLEWYYYEINCGNKTTLFTFSNTHVSGNAIYIRFNTAAAPVTINTDADIIFSNEVMSSSKRQFTANSSYLITIQFGIIKIEKITVNSNNSDLQN